MWKIYINFGWKEEFELADSQSFKTKKEACEWAVANGFQLKSVMRENEYKKRKETEKQHIFEKG